MTRRRSDATPEWMKNKRDNNEPEIVRTLRQAGAGWNSCSRHEGHDGWVIFRGIWQPVEVKNPSYRWELTPAEIRFMEFCERFGATCSVLETPADVLAMLAGDLFGK